MYKNQIKNSNQLDLQTHETSFAKDRPQRECSTYVVQQPCRFYRILTVFLRSYPFLFLIDLAESIKNIKKMCFTSLILSLDIYLIKLS